VEHFQDLRVLGLQPKRRCYSNQEEDHQEDRESNDRQPKPVDLGEN